jgi:hypothetical protein
MIPGTNILNAAFNLIGRQTLTLKSVTGRTTNSLGEFVNTYTTSTIQGSWQPVPKTLYQNLGLDMSKSFFTLHVPASVVPTGRGTAGDVVEIGGRQYQVESDTDWFGVDGWRAILCVDIGPVAA